MTTHAQDWRKLPAGRELNELVAVRVFGLMPLPRDSDGARVGYDVTDEHGRWLLLSAYSQNLAAAFEVLDQLGGVVTLKRLSPDGRDEWHCTIGHHTMWAESLPLAICRAALAATEASDA